MMDINNCMKKKNEQSKILIIDKYVDKIISHSTITIIATA